MKHFVVVHPNSKKPRIEKDGTEVLHVYVSKPPVEGQANLAVIEALAKHFKVSKSQVELVKGVKSKKKTFEIYGLE